jgi:hypothetical protein
MQIIEAAKEDYAAWREKNADPYSRRCFTFAEEWAALMEAQLAQGKTVESCAEECARIADTDGITGFMYGMAVTILSKCWVHGEALRRWHNSDMGQDRANATPGAVVNPAIMVVDDDGA